MSDTPWDQGPLYRKPSTTRANRITRMPLPTFVPKGCEEGAHWVRVEDGEWVCKRCPYRRTLRLETGFG
jgi:hypothetical protein